MAYNLTYDPSTDPEAIEAQEADEKESLAIGEKLDDEANQLLAGKYRDAEELERAYLELQQKLGSRSSADTDDNSADSEPEAEESEPEEEVGVIQQIAEEAAAGEFSQETLEYIKGLEAEQVADLLAQVAQSNEQSEQVEFTKEDAQTLMEVAGGEQAYGNMVAWASENLTQEEIKAYDAVMDSSDPYAMYFAVQALAYRYQQNVGYEGRMLTGGAAQSMDVFRSQAEVVRAMSDPRYDNDPAYRQDVFDKLERSDINF